MPHSAVRCPACGTLGDGNFCTGCGLDLRGPVQKGPARPASSPRLVACPYCGATNAASRRRCGRCGRAPGDPVVGASEAASVAERPAAPQPAERTTSATLVVVSVLAALAMIGVVLTILSARGVGPFAGPVEPSPGPGQALSVVAVRTSSALPPAGAEPAEPENVLDADLATAWQVPLDDGDDAWIELLLAEPSLVGRIVVANGHQRGDRFTRTARVSSVRILTGDAAFTADVLDVRGLQAIDLPEPVVTHRVRLEILAVHPGAGADAAALSSVELHPPP